MKPYTPQSLSAIVGTLLLTVVSSPALVVVLSDTEPAGSDLEGFLNSNFSNIDEIRHGNYANFNAAESVTARTGADLVIIGRSLSSGDYDAGDATGYNSLNLPVVSLTSYVARPDGTRLGWHTGGATTGTLTAGVEATITAAGQSVFGSGAMLDLADADDGSFNGLGSGTVGGGTILATIGTDLLAVSWAAGDAPGDAATAGVATFPAQRLLYNLDNDVDGDLGAFGVDGQAAFISALGTVGLVAVPEPSSTVLGLLGVAVLAFRRRR